MTTYNPTGHNYSPQQYPSYAPVFLPPQSVSSPGPGSPGPSFAKSEAPSTSSKLLAAQDRASRKRVARKTCLIATAIIILLIGMTCILLSYLCLAHKCSVSNLSLISTAPLGKVLTISQVTSHLAPVSVPIVMGLSSLLLGAKWLKSSTDPSSSLNRPSPMQLGLLLSICNAANLPAFVSSCMYVFKPKPAGNNGNLQNPPILRQSLLLLASLLTSVYLAAAADSWLHATSKSIDITTVSYYASSGARDLGREINETMCNASTYPDGTMSQTTCGLINGGSYGNGRTHMEGLRVVSNSSSLHRVVFTDDQTAILVPQNLPPNVTYSAETLGIQTQCTSVTKRCLAPTKFSDGSLSYGSDAALNLNCVSGGVKYGNGTARIGLCSLDDQGYCIQGWKISSNPFTAGEVIASQAYFGAAEDTFNPNTGWFVHGSNGAWNVVFCNVTALDVVYTYASSRYIVYKSVPTSTISAQHIMTVGFMEPTTAVSYAVDGAGLQENTTFEEAYSLELSRQTLARGAYMYEAKPVLEINNELIVIGTRLQIIPLVLFVAATLIFSLQVLIISLWTIIAASGIPYVHLAALYIKDPLTAVQRLYGHPDPVLTWEHDTNKRFGAESEADRLRIGPVMNDDHHQGAVFSVIKG